MLQEKLTCSVTRPNYTASHLRDFLNKLISTTKTNQNIHIFKGMKHNRTFFFPNRF